MDTSLVVVGAVFVAAAIAGKRLEGAGIKIPALDKTWQQICLTILGLLVMALGAIPSISSIVHSSAASPPGVTASATNDPPSTSSAEPVSSAPRASAASAPSSTPLISLPAVVGDNDGYVVNSATVGNVTYKNSLTSNGDICQPYGSVTYQTARKYKYFHALVGVTGNSQSGEDVEFSVSIDDDQDPGQTGQTINVGETPQPIDLDITGAFRITLWAIAPDCVYNGTAVWINPTLSN